MSKSLSKTLLIGNLGADPELRSTTSGKAVANVSLATSESWKDGKGETQEKTEWHRLVFWDKLAEIAREHLHKGDRIYIEGRLTYGSYDKDGTTHYTTSINVKELVMLGSIPKRETVPASAYEDDEGPPF